MPESVAEQPPRPHVILERQEDQRAFGSLLVLGVAALVVSIATDLHDWRGLIGYALGSATVGVFLVRTGRMPAQRAVTGRTPPTVAPDAVRTSAGHALVARDFGALLLLVVITGLALQNFAVPAVFCLSYALVAAFERRAIRAWEDEHGAVLARVTRPRSGGLRNPFRPSAYVAIRTPGAPSLPTDERPVPSAAVASEAH